MGHLTVVFTMITKVFVLCLIAGLSSADDRTLDWTQLLGAGLGAGAGAVPGAATGGVLGILIQTITRTLLSLYCAFVIKDLWLEELCLTTHSLEVWAGPLLVVLPGLLLEVLVGLLQLQQWLG